MDIKKVYWAVAADYWSQDAGLCSGCQNYSESSSDHPYGEGFATENHSECLAKSGSCLGVDENPEDVIAQIFLNVDECDSCEHHITEYTGEYKSDPELQVAGRYCDLAENAQGCECPALTNTMRTK